MDFSRLCINCMKEKDPEQNICPHCHFDQSTYTMPPYVLSPYTVLNGRYLVGKVLGKGGFGITYIAMDMMLERVVAIKEFFVQGYMYRDNSTSTSISVSTNAGDSQEQYYQLNRKKFEKEAKIIAHLDNLTGIVKVYDFFYENDTVYMVLEYLDGINLKEYVKEHGGKLSVNEVTSKLDSVMESLQNLHEHGILHRDISPDNIMVMGDGSLKLLDFGGAKIQANTGLSNMVIAKKGYTPIEQYHADGNQGAWTDVYAMAATIYYCITGQVPEESIQRVEKDTLKKPSELGAAMPGKQEEALLKALAVRGQDRYRSMEEFRSELIKSGKERKKESPKEKKVFTGVAVAAVAVGIIAGAGFGGAKGQQPSLDVRSIPEQLDENTVFTEDDPLVIKGNNLGAVDSLYLNNKKIENLKIVEKSSKELKVAFSVPSETGELSFYAKSHFMGIFSSSSDKADIEIYDSQIKVPEITELVKNGRSINGSAIRMKEAFTLGIKASDLPENAVVYVNGQELKDGKVEDGVLNVQVDDKLIAEINKAKKIMVQICPQTKEGHATSVKSDEVEKEVYGDMLDNSWLKSFQGDVNQIVRIIGMDNNKEAVQKGLDDLYNQGTRFLKFSPKYGIDLENIIDYVKSKKDLQLIVDVCGTETDKQSVYDILKDSGLIQSVIAMVDSPEDFELWSNVDKAQDRLRILFRASNAGMTFQQSLDYWKNKNIKAVSFSTDSYWSSTNLRNDDSVKKYEISFFCENEVNDEETDYLLHPEAYTDDNSDIQGITAFVTNAGTPANMKKKEDSLNKARYFRDSSDGSGMKDYLNALRSSGYTVMFAAKDDSKEIDNIAGELNALGLHSTVLGADDAFRNGYVAVVKTNADGSKPKLVLEQSKSSEDGVPLEADYTADNGRVFHLKSNGRKNDNDDASPVAEIFCGTAQYAPNEAGLNIVVYDEKNDCIVDRIWYDAWNNQNNDNPPLSKNHGKEWISLTYLDQKEDRKQRIIDYFNNLAQNKEKYMLIMAAGDDATINMDADIQKAMSQLGVTAAFDGDDGLQKSYVGLFGNDLGEISYTNGTNDEFSDMKITLNNFSYDGHTFSVVSEGHGLEDSLAQIVMDDQEMTNGQRGLHILVYDKSTHQAVNYSWIDCYDNLKFNSIDLVQESK